MKKPETNICDYCKRKATKYYHRKRLCPLHHLLENPERNLFFADWEKINRMKKFALGERGAVDEIRKYLKNGE